MAISLVGRAGASKNDGTDPVITLPTCLQNDIVIVVGGTQQNVSPAAGVVTSGYTTLDTDTNGFIQFGAFYKIQGGTPDTTVTCAGSGSSSIAAAYIAYVFRGVSTSTPIDATTTKASSASATAPNSPSITTVTNGAAVLTIGCDGVASVYTPPSGYGNDQQTYAVVGNGITALGAYKIVSTAGAENPAAWGWTFTGPWGMYTIALRPSTAGTFEDGVASFTGTGTATFIPASRLIATGSGTATWTGQAIGANPAPFQMTGTATVLFGGYGSSQGPFAITGSGSALFVGDRIYMTDVRQIIETGKATVNVK